MGNSPSSDSAPAAAASFERSTDGDDNASQVVIKMASEAMSPYDNNTIDASSNNKSTSPSAHNMSPSSFSLSSTGISIQTLGSGAGALPTTAELGMYTIDSLVAANQQTVGQTLGAALGGVGSAGGVIGYGNSNIAVGDALLSLLPKDLTASVLGGQLVAIGRLWPGSGRMMRSYRIRVQVSRIVSESSNISSEDNINSRPNNTSTSSTTASSLPFTINLVCKSFIVRSEHGEINLRQTLTEGDAELKRLRSLLSDPAVHPHVISYARWIIGQPSSSPPSFQSSPTSSTSVSRPIYLLRQNVHASLSDRLVSRPFLTSIEKTWIAYQLLIALQSLHDVGVCHGHLTTENVLLTSYNWVMISDLGCQHYKPVVLPDDDPGKWIYWFEGRGGAGEDSNRENSNAGHHRGGGNGEKKCCLAPERFYSTGYATASSKTTEQTNDKEGQDRKGNNDGSRHEASIPTTKLTPEMDVFSLGCVLIELFLNGERALDLGDLMEYRRQGSGNNADPTPLPLSLKQKLDKIESSKIRAACRHMLSLDPSKRLKPLEYLERISSTPSSAQTNKRRGDDTNGEVDESKKETQPQSSATSAPVPTCFKSVMYPFMLRLRLQILSPDARIALVAINYGDILKASVGVRDEWGIAYFSRVLGPTLRRYVDSAHPRVTKENDDKTRAISLAKKAKQKNTVHSSLDELLTETEDFLRQLDSGVFVSNVDDLLEDPTDQMLPKTLSKLGHILQSPSEFNSMSQPSPSQSSVIILLQVVLSSVGHVLRPSSKYVALVLSKLSIN